MTDAEVDKLVDELMAFAKTRGEAMRDGPPNPNKPNIDSLLCADLRVALTRGELPPT